MNGVAINSACFEKKWTGISCSKKRAQVGEGYFSHLFPDMQNPRISIYASEVRRRGVTGSHP
jgi:hypothetical protein